MGPSSLAAVADDGVAICEAGCRARPGSGSGSGSGRREA